jgi:hypothetical protein
MISDYLGFVKLLEFFHKKYKYSQIEMLSWVSPQIKAKKVLVAESSLNKIKEILLLRKLKMEAKKMVKWIHTGGHSRPDKRTIKKGGTKKK